MYTTMYLLKSAEMIDTTCKRTLTHEMCDVESLTVKNAFRNRNWTNCSWNDNEASEASAEWV